MMHLVILACILCIVGCGDQPPPRPPAEPPPAAKEVQTLREQELAAEKRAAEASAAGDQGAADYNRRLADELAKVRAKWERIEAEQRQQIADRQAKVDDEAQRLAEVKQAAADVRRARIIAAIGLALCAGAAALGSWFGLARVAIPVAGALALACLTLAAFAESARSWWFLPAVLGGLAILVVAWVRIARGDRAVVDLATLADSAESGAVAAAAKARAWSSQRAAGLLHRVAKARGKPVKLQPPKV